MIILKNGQVILGDYVPPPVPNPYRVEADRLLEARYADFLAKFGGRQVNPCSA